VFDKSDISTVSTKSILYLAGGTGSKGKAYSFDVSETYDKVMVISNAAYPDPDDGIYYEGRTGDGHHPEIGKWSISTVDGTMAREAVWYWNAATMDVCDTLSIYGDDFYVSCGFWEVTRTDGVLPMVARFDIATMTYAKHY
jgi:hypothetical protein